jgi:tricorn protease
LFVLQQEDSMTRRIASAAIAAIPLLTLLLLAPRAASSNGAPTRLLRMPTVSANAIACAYANNIWTVERAGGTARRLTSFQGESSNPHFSPDGKFIAFSAEYAGNVDVYVVPADGGEPKRLTWHPGNDFVQGWTPDGKRDCTCSRPRVRAGRRAAAALLDRAGRRRRVEQLAAGGYKARFPPTGQIAYRMNNSWDEERRNYRGGQNRPIWIVDLKTYDPVRRRPDRLEGRRSGGWATRCISCPIATTAWPTSGSTDTRSKKPAQVTSFVDFDVKLDRRRRRRDRGARTGRRRPRARSKSGKRASFHHGRRRFPVDDAAVEET